MSVQMVPFTLLSGNFDQLNDFRGCTDSGTFFFRTATPGNPADIPPGPLFDSDGGGGTQDGGGHGMYEFIAGGGGGGGAGAGMSTPRFFCPRAFSPENIRADDESPIFASSGRLPIYTAYSRFILSLRSSSTICCNSFIRAAISASCVFASIPARVSFSSFAFILFNVCISSS